MVIAGDPEYVYRDAMRKDRTVDKKERKRHMALRLKKVTPEFEEVEDGAEDDVQWITYVTDNPRKDLLAPYLKTAEAMIDPTKPNAYYLKRPAAERFAAALGEGYGIEAGRIGKVLPFAVEWDYAHANKAYREGVWTTLRDHMGRWDKAVYADLKGVHFYAEGKKPDAMKKGWLYVGVPRLSTCWAQPGRFEGARLTPQLMKANIAAPQRLNNGISDEDNIADYAIISPQTIHIRAYYDDTHYGDILSSLTKRGAQKAMAYEGGAVKLDNWLVGAAEAFAAQRATLLKKEEDAVIAHKNAINEAATKIMDSQFKLEACEAAVAALRMKPTPEGMVKQFPTLGLIESVNQDDPTMTEMRTRDIVLHDVNLGPYLIQLYHETPRVVVKAKRSPDGVVHPNLWLDEKTNKWSWDLEGEKLKELITCLSTQRLYQAAALVLENLSNAPNKGDHAKRLDVMRKFIEDAEAKKAAKRKKDEPKIEEKVDATV